MAATLVEYKYLGQAAEIRRGIGLTIVKENPWLVDLPFVQIPNDTSRYKMETAEARADTYQVGDTWVEGTPTWEYRDAALAILGGDADDDNFGSLAAAGEDTMGALVELKTKAISNWFSELCILGQTTSQSAYSQTKNFKGILRLIAEAESSSTTDLDGATYSSYGNGGNNTQVVNGAASASATLTLDMLDVLIDVVRPKPTHIITHRSMLRKITSLARAAGTNLEHDNNQLGFPVTKYGNIILVQDDYMPIQMSDPSSSVTAIASYSTATAWAAGNDTVPILAVRFGEDGLCGINGEGMIQVERFEKLETKDAKRVRIKFYAGLRLTNKLAAGALMGTTIA